MYNKIEIEKNRILLRRCFNDIFPLLKTADNQRKAVLEGRLEVSCLITESSLAGLRALPQDAYLREVCQELEGYIERWREYKKV